MSDLTDRLEAAANDEAQRREYEIADLLSEAARQISKWEAGEDRRDGEANAAQRELEAIVRAGAALCRAIDGLNRPRLRALADRLDLDAKQSSKDLRTAIRRKLLGLR